LLNFELNLPPYAVNIVGQTLNAQKHIPPFSQKIDDGSEPGETGSVVDTVELKYAF
jgi:hypothetical protein